LCSPPIPLTLPEATFWVLRLGFMSHTSSPIENCKTKATFRIQLQYNCLGNSSTYITTITHLITTTVQLKYNYMPTTIPVKQPENNYGTCHR
jgi:hypothetical protein